MMKAKQLLFMLATMLATLWTAPAIAQDKEAYAVLNSDAKTLTFYYDADKGSRPGIHFDMPAVGEKPRWTGRSPYFPNYYYEFNTAHFDDSFAQYTELTSLQRWLSDCFHLKNVTGLANLNTTNVTDMSYMFSDTEYLLSLDLSELKTDNVTNMQCMFASCHSLTSLNLSGFNTANVTNMTGMFTGCHRLTSLDLSGFNTGKVTSMESMFASCYNLAFLDLSSFNTAGVTDMGGMFKDCHALTSLDLTNFNTKRVYNMYNMFKGCQNLTTIYCNDTWTSHNSMDMFEDCTQLKGAVPYDSSETSVDMANPDNGYFTRAVTAYGLAICGAQVTSANCADLTAIEGVTVAAGGKVTFDPETNTLTLKDASIVPTAYDYPENGIMATIDSLVIHVEGTNRVANNYNGYAISNTGTLTIDGTGSIDAQGGDAGIHSKNNILIRNCTVTATGEENGSFGLFATNDILIDQSTVNASAGWTAIVSTKDLIIRNSTVTGTGDNWGISTNGGSATIEQSTVKATGTGHASMAFTQSPPVLIGCAVTQPEGGIWSTYNGISSRYYMLCTDGAAVKTEVIISPEAAATYDLTICGAKVTSENCADLTTIEGVTVAAGGKATFDPATNTLTLKDASIVPTAYDYPENGIMATIDSLVIHVEGTNRVANNYDGYAISNTGTLTIDGTGSIDAQGGDAGIYSTNNILIRNCTVTSKGKFGIYAEGNLVIDQSTVNASADWLAIFSNGNMTIKNSTVTGTGGERGVSADGGSATIEQSTVKATGTESGSMAFMYSPPVLIGCTVTQPEGGTWSTYNGISNIYYMLCTDGAAVKTEVIISPETTTTYDVVLLDVGSDRKAVTDSLKAITGITLPQAITLVGNAPCIVLADVPQSEAQHLADVLAAAGATMQVVPHGTWIPTGITNTETDVPARRQGIYSLDGVKLNQTWESLPKGVYIVNGKKAVKR